LDDRPNYREVERRTEVLAAEERLGLGAAGIAGSGGVSLGHGQSDHVSAAVDANLDRRTAGGAASGVPDQIDDGLRDSPRIGHGRTIARTPDANYVAGVLNGDCERGLRLGGQIPEVYALRVYLEAALADQAGAYEVFDHDMHVHRAAVCCSEYATYLVRIQDLKPVDEDPSRRGDLRHRAA